MVRTRGYPESRGNEYKKGYDDGYRDALNQSGDIFSMVLRNELKRKKDKRR